MYIRIKDAESMYPEAFINPRGIHKVYVHDKSGGGHYFMVKADGPRGYEYSGDSAGEEIFYQDPELVYDSGGMITGYLHVNKTQVDVLDTDELDNEHAIEFLEPMEVFY